jgi:hypothetical protein
MKVEFYEMEVTKVQQIEMFPVDEPKEVVREKFLLEGEMNFDQAKEIGKVLAVEVPDFRQVVVKIQNTINKVWWEGKYYVQGKMSSVGINAEQEAKDPGAPPPVNNDETNIVLFPQNGQAAAPPPTETRATEPPPVEPPPANIEEAAREVEDNKEIDAKSGLGKGKHKYPKKNRKSS